MTSLSAAADRRLEIGHREATTSVGSPCGYDGIRRRGLDTTAAGKRENEEEEAICGDLNPGFRSPQRL